MVYNMFYFTIQYVFYLFVFYMCICVQSNGIELNNYSYNATIKVTSMIKGSNGYNHDKIFVVKENEPFQITFLNITSPVCCKNAKLNPCNTDKNLYCSSFTETERVTENDMTIIKVSRATEHIGNCWICTFKITDETDLRISFQMSVKSIKDKPTVIIGGEKTTPTKGPASTWQYDYTYTSWYNEGELIDLVCFGSSDGKIRLRYFHSNGTKSIETDQIEAKKQLTFRKVMKSVNNGDMIDCEYTKKNEQHSTIQRTIFYLNSNDRVLKFLINNQALHSTNGKNLYYYKYFKGDILNITCKMNEGIDRLIFGKKNNHDWKSSIHEEKINNLWHTTIKLNTESIDKKHLICETNGNNKAVIEFHSEKRELFIKGLPPNNVINEYNKNSNTWIIDYQYTVGETLYLECVARDDEDKVQWSFEGETTRAIKENRKRLFHLKYEHNEEAIICETNDDDEDDVQRVIVELHETVKYLESTTERPKDGPIELNDFIVPAACLLVVFVIGIMAACFCRWFKKTKLLRAEQNPYANLQDPDQPIPPYPVQWNNKLQKQTNSEEQIKNNVLYNSNAPVYALPQKKKLKINANDKNTNQNKYISKVGAKINDETEVMVDSSMYNVDALQNSKPNQSINNEEVPEYNYIEANTIFNSKVDTLRNTTRDPKNKPISKVGSKFTDETQVMVDNYMYNVDNAPTFSYAQKSKPNQEEVPEYNYIETNDIFNLKDDKLKNITRDTAPVSRDIRTNDDVMYVEPYASHVHLNAEPSGSNQAQPSNSKEVVYDYVYAGRYANKMACGVDFNEDS